MLQSISYTGNLGVVLPFGKSISFFKRIVVLLLIIVSNHSFSQTIQLGSGTTESSNYSSSPVNIYYRRTVCQFVYTAAELAAAGASTTSPISQLGFYVTEAPIYDLPAYTIKLVHTSQTDVSSRINSNDWIEFKRAHTYSPNAGGFDMQDADDDFTWDGVNNIGVEICWSQVSPSWDASGKVRVYNTTNGYRYTWTDNAGSSCGASPNTVSADKPQLQMVFIQGTSTTWTGATSTDWFDPTNWTVGVPTDQMDCEIPSGTTNNAIIGSGTGRTKNLNIQSGATLETSGSSTIEVHGDWTNYGTYTANSGTLAFAGLGTNSISGAGTQEIYNMAINSVGGATISSGTYNINNALYLNGGNFNTNSSVNIVSNASGTARIPEVKGICQYTLNMNDSYGDGWNGGYITVNFDGEPYGNYSCSGSSSSETIYAPSGVDIELVYSAGSYENENTYDLVDSYLTTIFSDGTTPATGSVFTTTSDCAFSNPVVGSMNIFRYVDAGATHWRMLSFPTSDATIADLNDDFLTSGFSGSDYPEWPTAADPWESIWMYNETTGTAFDDGYVAPTGTSESVGAGRGMSVWCGDQSSGTDPFTIDVFGEPNVGDIDLNVTYTSTGTPSADGWNLVGNPYACTIDWDAADWIKTNMANATYIWNPDSQQWASYVGGLGVNGGSRYIAPWQSFFVQSTGASPSLVAKEACKVDQDQAFLKASNNPGEYGIFALSSSSNTDQMAVRVHPDCSNDFDETYDAEAFGGNVDAEVRMVTELDGLQYAINSVESIEEGLVLPVLISTSGSQTLTFKVEELSSLTAECIVLEDLTTGAMTNLRVDSSYSFFQIATVDEHRFNLHFNNGPNVTVVPESCEGKEDGLILVSTTMGDASFNWADANGNNLKFTDQVGQDSLVGLAEGTYEVEISGLVCGSGIQEIIVDQVESMHTLSDVIVPSCDTCCDGQIELSISGGTSPFSIEWTGLSGSWPIVSGVCSGDYIFNLTDANGCELESSVYVGGVNVTELENDLIVVYPNPGDGIINIELEAFLDYNAIEVLNMMGQVVDRIQIGSGNPVINISDLTKGTYIIRFDHKSDIDTIVKYILK